MGRSETFVQSVDKLREIGTTQSTVGTTILSILWGVYSVGLYRTESYAGVSYKDFRDFCETAIAPYYEDPDYFYDFSNIVDRVFVYVHGRYNSDHPLKDDKGNVVTVQNLIDKKGWIGKLISISQHIDACETDQEIEKLFDLAFKGTRDDVKNGGQEIRNHHQPVRIEVIVQNNGDTSWNIMALNQNDEQKNLILKKLEKIADIHLD